MDSFDPILFPFVLDGIRDDERESYEAYLEQVRLEEMEKEKDPRLMRYVPKSKIEAISTAWVDSDGMWIILNEGWNADRMDSNCRTIHEDYIKDLKWQIAGIRKVK